MSRELLGLLGLIVGVRAWPGGARPGNALLAAPDEGGERRWIGRSPNFLPSVTCVQIVALEGSEELPTLLKELSLMGMMPRVNYTVRPPDPDGKDAGCFRGHVAQWNQALDRGCGTTLVLEEDAIFDGPVLQQAMARAEAFVASQADFDLFFLGWESNLLTGGHLNASQRTTLEATLG